MIRPATLADLQRITAIYNEVILEGGFTGDLEPLSIEKRRAWFADHQGRHVVLVKIVDGSVAGYATISPYRNGRGAFQETGEITYYLSAQHRGCGLGKELVGHALKYADDVGLRSILAIVLERNQRSIGLLLKFGFSVAGRLPKVAKIGGEYIDHIYLSRCTVA
jgi:phosphinothricin acetyltransferase